MPKPGEVRILVVDDDDGIRKTVRLCLTGAGYRVTEASTGEAAVQNAKRSPPDLALVDLRLGGMDGLAVTKALKQEVPHTTIVLMTAYATIDNAVEAIRSGAFDYLPKPFTPQQLLHTVQRALESAHLVQRVAELERAGRGVQARFETKSPAMKQVLEMAARVADSEATVLLLGETGTGKGVLARHIHALSTRNRRPFVTVNCAVIAPTLIESELFGHARGAFTGADSAHAGHVEAAGSGTLFLDEVGDLPREAQGKLLRLLEEHEYVRVGDVEPRHADARVIAATHRDLKEASHEGRFREDLYFRLNVVTLRLPPLRERREDILGLADAMVADLAQQHRRRAVAISAGARDALLRYDWPGNLRELVNVLERCVILVQGDEITPDLLPEELREVATTTPGDDSLEAMEKRHIAAVLARYPRIDLAARALGIDPSTLFRKRERYGLK